MKRTERIMSVEIITVNGTPGCEIKFLEAKQRFFSKKAAITAVWISSKCIPIKYRTFRAMEDAIFASEVSDNFNKKEKNFLELFLIKIYWEKASDLFSNFLEEAPQNSPLWN